jgi:membrane protease subunit (stomatin/prohibitin family)
VSGGRFSGLRPLVSCTNEDPMQWGGPLSLFDTMTSTQVAVRTFGAFEGTIAHPNGEAILQPMLLEAVQAAAAQHGGPVLSLGKDKDAIAVAAQALLAPRLHEVGAAGQLSIAAFTFPDEEYERLSAFAMQAAMARRAAAAAAPPAEAAAESPAPVRSTDACTKCGAQVPGKFCRECGTARAAAVAPAAAAPAAVAAAPAAAPLAVGVAVRVQWSDGKHYPGVVRECRADQVLVGFPNGGMQWIPTQFVSPA